MARQREVMHSTVLSAATAIGPLYTETRQSLLVSYHTNKTGRYKVVCGFVQYMVASMAVTETVTGIFSIMNIITELLEQKKLLTKCVCVCVCARGPRALACSCCQ
jgi:hypothetical protein